MCRFHLTSFLFFNDTATTEIYPLSLHDALPIWESFAAEVARRFHMEWEIRWWDERRRIAILVSRHDHCLDRKSTRLNSSHTVTSYAVFCLKKKRRTSESSTAAGPE